MRRVGRPAILARIPPDRPALLEASAGTGKTYAIEHLIVDLLVEGRARIDQILVVTFTEKATAELRHRIRIKIEQIVGGLAPEPRPGEDAWTIDEAATERLTAALAAFDLAPIHTIHAFCQRVLLENPFAGGRLFRQEQTDRATAFDAAFKAALRRTLSTDEVLRPWLLAWLRAGHKVSALGDLLFESLTAGGGRLDRIAPAGLSDRLAEVARAGPDASPVPLAAAVCHLFGPIVADVLRSMKAERGLFDFDDMLRLVDEALDAPGGDALTSALRRRYRYALVDEFQDTDEVQWRIFGRLFLGQGATGILYAVGDPKQAIYSFRGADVQAYLAARDQLDAAGGERAALTVNHRSTGRFLQAVNRILDQGARRPFFTAEGIRYDEPVTCGRDEFDALGPDGRPLAPVVLLEATPADDRKVRADELRDQLGHRIALEIGRLVAGGLRTTDGDGRTTPIEHDDIYVLTRTGGEADQIAVHLRAAGIPFSFYKQEGLFASREAEAVRDLLAGVADPFDRAARNRAWRTPFFGVPLERLPATADLDADDPLFRRLVEWKDLADRKAYEDLFARIVDESGLVRRELLLSGGRRPLTNTLHILEILLRQIHRTHPDLRDLVAMLDGIIAGTRRPETLEDDIQRLEGERRAVQVMTMHKSKGLQAPVVFLFGGFTSPGSSARETRVSTFHRGRERWLAIGPVDETTLARIETEAREEDQRLLYVALTRARCRVYLPLVPKDAYAIRKDAAYRQLNDRLIDLRPIVDESEDFERVVCDRPPPVDERSVRPDLAGPVDPAVLEVGDPTAGRLAALRPRWAGPFLTSFSRMRREGAGEEVRPGLDEALGPEIDLEPTPEPDPLDLPGGTRGGTFFHELLEAVPLADLADRPPLDRWAGERAVEALFTDALRRHGFAEALLRPAQAVVHRVLTTPIRVPGFALEEGLASIGTFRREAEFVAPFPGGGGYLEGSIDLLFERGGRVFLLDWKNNRLDDYGPARIEAEVVGHYELQLRIYSLALVRMLGIADAATHERLFGGVLYVFLRGVAADDRRTPGVHFDRPSFADIERWRSDLARRVAPGQAPR